MADSSKPHKFITVPVSHYCDRARWALDIAQVPYVEDMWPPVLHFKATKIDAPGKTSSIPILVLFTGQQLRDSADIVQWVARTCPDKAGHLYPQPLLEQIEKYEVLFSKRLGPAVRTVAYHYLFKQPRKEYLEILTWGMPSWRRNVFCWLSYPFVSMIKSGYRINDKSVSMCTEKVRTLLSDVSKDLSDGRPFLVAGSTAPTAADITFASMLGPLLSVPNYGGELQIKVPELGPGPELLATPAGQHALKMYTQYRLPATVQ